MVAGLTLATPATALAQSEATAAPDYKRANELAGRGFDAFDRGRFAEAHDLFAEADNAAHSPVFVLYMARCKRELGELGAAQTLFDRVIDEDLADDAPVPFRSAQDDARKEREALEALRPEVAITFEGILPADRVLLDSAPAEIQRRGARATLRRRLAAGSHALVVMRDGATLAERAVEVKLGQGVQTTIVLPAPTSTTPSPAAPPHPSPPVVPTSSEPNLVPAYVALGVAGAGAVVGAVMGGLALARDKTAVDELNSCDSDSSCADAERTRDRALTFAHVSTTSFVVASVAAATGVVLILVAPTETTTVGLGPGSLSLTTRF